MINKNIKQIKEALSVYLTIIKTKTKYKSYISYTVCLEKIEKNNTSLTVGDM